MDLNTGAEQPIRRRDREYDGDLACLTLSIPGVRNMDRKFPIKVAVLDDYQNVALSMADWSPLENLADITVFNDHVADIGNLIQRLRPFDVVCLMRERTPLSRVVIE